MKNDRIIVCPVCDKRIKDGQKITVYATDITCLGDDASYDFIGEFVENETIVHAGCFNKKIIKDNNNESYNITNKSDRNDTMVVEGGIAPQLHRSLRAIGESASESAIENFVIRHNCESDIKELIKLWFKSKPR